MSNKDYLSNISILVVDDNAFIQKMMRNILAEYGARSIRVVSSGDAALKYLDAYLSDIIIADYAMPPINGIELTRTIRNSDDVNKKYLPIIMMSEDTDARLIAVARNVGITEFLVKPFSATEALERIRNVIEHPRSYIKSRNFFGPDRRRRVKNRDDERRKTKVGIVAEPHYDKLHVGNNSSFYSEQRENGPFAPTYHSCDQKSEESSA